MGTIYVTYDGAADPLSTLTPAARRHRQARGEAAEAAPPRQTATTVETADQNVREVLASRPPLFANADEQRFVSSSFTVRSTNSSRLKSASQVEGTIRAELQRLMPAIIDEVTERLTDSPKHDHSSFAITSYNPASEFSLALPRLEIHHTTSLPRDSASSTVHRSTFTTTSWRSIPVYAAIPTRIRFNAYHKSQSRCVPPRLPSTARF